ncbi:hypothetical protein H271_21240 [Vibrio parahaemolyticus 1911C]|nr:hypothetical protein H271_21240 [Vibrio parahaemolyticus 1911C]
MFEVGSLLFVERSIIGGITNMQSTISSGLTQQVWGSQCWHSIKNSELNTSDYELTEKNKAKIDECLKERQEAMDARIGQDGYNAQISKINRQSAKIVNWPRMTLFGVNVLMLSCFIPKTLQLRDRNPVISIWCTSQMILKKSSSSRLRVAAGRSAVVKLVMKHISKGQANMRRKSLN